MANPIAQDLMSNIDGGPKGGLPRPSAPADAGGRGGLVWCVVATAGLLAFAQALPLAELAPDWLGGLHFVIKIAGTAIALSVALLACGTRPAQPLNLTLTGIAFFAVAVLGAGHLVMLQDIPGQAWSHGARKHVVMLLGADSAVVLGLLATALVPAHMDSVPALRAGMIGTAAWIGTILTLSVLAPDRWTWSQQATAGVELALAGAALAIAIVLFSRHHRGAPDLGLPALAALVSAMGLAEGAGLRLADDSTGVFYAGYKAVTGLLVYLALFRQGVLAPRKRLLVSRRAVEDDRLRYQQLFNSAPDGLLLIDCSGQIVLANPSAAAMFGWGVGEMTGQPVEALMPERLRAVHAVSRARFNVKPQAREMGRGGPLWAARRDGTAFPVEVALVPHASSDGRSTLCIVRDMTARRELEQTLIRQALHDALTDLPNRRQFRDSLARALANDERHGGVFALLFIDLDNFKQINDTFGHSVGDTLLCQVARRLIKTLRAGDLLARMGGDEFALMLPGASGDDAAAVASKVLGVMEAEFPEGKQTLKVGASIGITLYPADGHSVEELLSNADLAMYRAKQRGRNTWCFFEQHMTERLRERSSLQNDLAHAIERGQFSLVYQPRVSAADGALTGFEALLRWRHPERGNVPPEVFIALAEETGLIVAIGEWVLREGCTQAARWRHGGAPDLTMAVNVSTHQLRHPGFAGCVQTVLSQTGWPARQLELEITETALMEDPREAACLLQRISAMGVRFAVDDFGTGYSSLAYLKTFALHRLKVDRSFVQALLTDRSDRVIACSIIGLAHALGLQVTAEGVETADQRDFLLQQRCDELQGYLFSAPISATHCEAWLSRAQIANSEWSDTPSLLDAQADD